ncbi:hypothetical protein ACFOY2_33055 [Nonomuraea purpurea]|uniref:PH domain-containing protein n=1 Tax=Nonomuraea purpurea TaxID=1849276 RepID=A0ABV8GIW9_9ACTN
MGALAAFVGAASIVFLDSGSAPAGAGVFPSMLCGAGLGAFGMGLVLGWPSITRSDEVFILYEHGLVHAYGGTSWAFGWEEMATVTIPEARENALARLLGGGVRCQIRLATAAGGGRNVVITGLSEAAEWLAETVRQAVQDGVHPKLRRVAISSDL